MRGLRFFLILVGAMLACLGASKARAQAIDPRWGVLADMAERDLSGPNGMVSTVRWVRVNESIDWTDWALWARQTYRFSIDPQSGLITAIIAGQPAQTFRANADNALESFQNNQSTRTTLSAASPGVWKFSPNPGVNWTYQRLDPTARGADRLPKLIAQGKVRAANLALNGSISMASSRPSPPVAAPDGQTELTVSAASPTAKFRPNAPRIALIIGNSDYGAAFGSLPNPGNDADAMAAALTALGFKVELIKDVDQKNMKRAIARFGARLRQAGRSATGLFFYAGHGLQTGGINYLVPVNAAIEAEADVDLESVAADTVLRQMEEAGSATNIVILDACRNMPLARSLRGGTRGLARMEAPNGSFVAYSTAPGSVAVDGTGRNSPFVTALVKAMQQKGQPIETIFRTVRRSVLQQTGGRQTPWDSSSLIDPFYFAGE